MKKNLSGGLLFHNILSSYGIVQSMSGKGNCYDNAYAESFFGTLEDRTQDTAMNHDPLQDRPSLNISRSFITESGGIRH